MYSSYMFTECLLFTSNEEISSKGRYCGNNIRVFDEPRVGNSNQVGLLTAGSSSGVTGVTFLQSCRTESRIR